MSTSLKPKNFMPLLRVIVAELEFKLCSVMAAEKPLMQTDHDNPVMGEGQRQGWWTCNFMDPLASQFAGRKDEERGKDKEKEKEVEEDGKKKAGNETVDMLREREKPETFPHSLIYCGFIILSGSQILQRWTMI